MSAHPYKRGTGATRARCIYLGDGWRPLRDAHEMNNGQVIEAWHELRRRLVSDGYSYRDINTNRLDNPFMSPLALKVLLGDRAIKRVNFLAGRKRASTSKQHRRAA